MRPLGAVVVDEVVLPVIGVRLANGAVVIDVEAWGPLPAVDTDTYTVHDAEGRVVYRRKAGGDRLTWPAFLRGSRLTLTVQCDVDNREANAGTVAGIINA